ncbi:MAG: AAA family ATPase, partial [Bryobacteraceae bacterium]
VARCADEILLVTTNELPTLHAAQKTLAHLERNNIDRSKVRLIINRYNPNAGLGREAIETALHLDVFDVLPNDYEAVQRSLMEGKTVSPGSLLGRAIAQMAERLSGKQTKVKRQSVLSGIFSLFES